MRVRGITVAGMSVWKKKLPKASVNFCSKAAGKWLIISLLFELLICLAEIFIHIIKR